jgi:hypothetical protein
MAPPLTGKRLSLHAKRSGRSGDTAMLRERVLTTTLKGTP